jgi:hypothetical protein
MYELWSNPARQADWLYMMSLVDLVQTSTAALAEAFKPYCSRVVVFLNQLAKVPEDIPPKKAPPLVVGWAGSLSHVADVAHVARAVSKWIAEHDDVALWVMGHPPMEKLFALPPEKKKYFPWGGMEAYEDFLKGVHIGLAPLLDTPFNRSRSDVKWLEYAAQGCVFVGQRLPTFADSVQHGKTGFLFSDTGQLLRILDKLNKDRSLLDSVSRAAFAHVTKKRRYEDDARERAKVYREFLERKWRHGAMETAPPPERPASAAQTEWNLDTLSNFPRLQLPNPLPGYLPIHLDAQDGQALVELHSRRPNVSDASIKRVEQRYGEFHLTSYARAVVAMRQRDFRSAEQHLRRSLSFYPAALASMQFLAQILEGTQRAGDARNLLLVAAQWHRACTPVYRQLIGIAERRSEWAAGVDAADEWAKHCNQDPGARLRKGLLLIRSGRAQEGLDALAEAMNQYSDRLKHGYSPFAAELVATLREAEALVSKESRWPELILKAAELFPYGIWLPTRAGTICFERGEFERGKRLLQQAREHLDALEWQRIEGLNVPPEYRRLIEFHRMACEELAAP